jgi:isopentenyldiphosphate isomerase
MKETKESSRWALAVYVVVTDPKKRVLLLRRTRTRSHFPGCW